jgi:hypothetical protein
MLEYKELFEIRIYERSLKKSVQYDISLRRKSKAKTKKRTQFCCTLSVTGKTVSVVGEKRSQCIVQTDFWNDNTFITMSKAILIWFLDNVKIVKAFETSDDTIIWHLQKTDKLGDRYTLYDCSMPFIKRNIAHFARKLRTILYELD